MENYFDFPFLGYGVGLRPPHYSHILEHQPAIDWFEIISENYMDTDGRPRRMLEKIVAKYPVIMHGVSLSIGTIDPIDSNYLKQLKALAEWVKPAWVSDHLCWTGIAHKNTHDLLPIPYTEEALAHLVERIKRVQDFLGRPLVLENPSSYLEFSASSMPEWEFISRMAEQADCALLLDANNIYVSCYNHRWDAKHYIDALPLERVAQIHLAGHTNKGSHIIDTHDTPVIDEVWNLYGYIMQRAKRPISTMVEWDDNIPSFEALESEINKARHWGNESLSALKLPEFSPYRRNNASKQEQPVRYSQLLETMQEMILAPPYPTSSVNSWIEPKPNFSPIEQVGVYHEGYRYRLFDIAYNDYPALRHYLGKAAFRQLMNRYIEETPSHHFNISRYTSAFPEFLYQNADTFAYEMALLETQISQLHDETETPPLTQENISEYFPKMTPENFMQIRLQGRAALKLLALSWNVNDYFSAVKEGISPPSTRQESNYLAVFRHEDRMWRLALEEAEYLLLSSLFSGLSIAEAMQASLPSTMDEDQLTIKLSKWFARWINNGLLATPCTFTDAQSLPKD